MSASIRSHTARAARPHCPTVRLSDFPTAHRPTLRPTAARPRYLWGVTLCFLLPIGVDASVAGVLLLAICDPAASIVGSYFVRRMGV